MIIGNKDGCQRRGRDILNYSFIIAEEELMRIQDSLDNFK